MIYETKMNKSMQVWSILDLEEDLFVLLLYTVVIPECVVY